MIHDSPTSGSLNPRASVLVADDQPAVRELFAEILKLAGYEVTVVSRGSEALVRAREHDYDVLVSDVQMPDLDGVRLLKTLRSEQPDLPVILITGQPELESAIHAVRYHAVNYLLKPIPGSRLLEAVDEAVKLRRFARLKREAMRLAVVSHASDQVDLPRTFDRALASVWLARQPIVDLPRGVTFGWEVLLRSDEPSLARPIDMIHAAEVLGRREELGIRVRALSAQLVESIGDGTLFVNLHPNDLGDDDLYDPSSPLSRVASRVVLEITERAGLDDIEDLDSRMSRLRSLGYRIALDDLGAGYASLNSFGQLAPEIVKVDMSLVRSVDRNPTKARLIGSLVRLCREMDVRLIAEGIQTPEERDALVELGCRLFQGFYFGEPARTFESARSEAFGGHATDRVEPGTASGAVAVGVGTGRRAAL